MSSLNHSEKKRSKNFNKIDIMKLVYTFKYFDATGNQCTVTVSSDNDEDAVRKALEKVERIIGRRYNDTETLKIIDIEPDRSGE
jgi:hypothetical protein